jgi:LemA protein
MLLFLAVLIVGLAVATVYGSWATYNRLMALDERCDTAFADIDVQLKHRHNIIPPLVETVRAFAGHEKGVLTAVTECAARRKSRDASRSGNAARPMSQFDDDRRRAIS